MNVDDTIIIINDNDYIKPLKSGLSYNCSMSMSADGNFNPTFNMAMQTFFGNSSTLVQYCQYITMMSIQMTKNYN